MDRVFGLDSQLLVQIIANLINLGILAAALTYLLYKPVRNILHKRAEKIQGQMLQAEEDLAKALEIRKQYEQKMEDIEREKDEILVEARKQAAETGRRLISEAKAEAEVVRERAAANVQMEWERAEEEMRAAIIDVSAVMAEKFVSLAIDKDTHDRLFSETISDLEGMSWRD